MPLKILIAPDKFKGTLSAPEAAEAVARGWRRARPGDALELLPMSDGGDGFGEAMRQLLGARAQIVKTVDAAQRPIAAKWWWDPAARTAIIESAAVIGLAMLPPGRFHPFELDTFGLGAVLKAAAKKGARCCLLGIGGSATNDGGFGVARAMGWRFLRRTGAELERWTDLGSLAEVLAPRSVRWFRELVVAVDVKNPLLGVRGATRVYGPQKGIRPEEFRPAERCLRRLALVTTRTSGRKLSHLAGAGAAGGLGFGLSAFLGARLTSGFELFAKLARLDGRLRRCDCVITGEGAIDRSTLMGKGVSELARRARSLGKPCIALGGVVAASAPEWRLFSAAHALTELTNLEDAKAQPALWLERLSERSAQTFAPKAASPP
ncbi:MAG TPA: glycerate kinase [Verrucomicrobiae bacterium]